MSAPAPADAVVMRTGASAPRFGRAIPHHKSASRLIRVATDESVAGAGDRIGCVESAAMSNRTYRVTELVGTSPDGIDEAIRNAVRRASATLRHVDWFEVTQVRGQVKDGDVEHFQVGLKVGFRLEDE